LKLPEDDAELSKHVGMDIIIKRKYCDILIKPITNIFLLENLSAIRDTVTGALRLLIFVYIRKL